MAADTVTNVGKPSLSDESKYVVHLTGISGDGAGESDIVKIDRSALLLPGAAAPTAPSRINISSIRWNIQGFSYIKLAWNHTIDDTIAVLSGNGYDNWEEAGNLIDPNTSGDVITGAIGDVQLTSIGAAAGASYDITIVCQLS